MGSFAIGDRTRAVPRTKHRADGLEELRPWIVQRSACGQGEDGAADGRDILAQRRDIVRQAGAPAEMETVNDPCEGDEEA
jgi:hypothetical protein